MSNSKTPMYAALGLLLVTSVFGSEPLSRESLEGNWVAACAGGATQRLSIVLSRMLSDRFTLETRFHQDPECRNAAYSMRLSGGVKVSAPAQIDFQLTSVAMMPLNSDMAAAFNSGKVCGISNWTVGKEKDITKCPSSPFAAIDELKNIVKLDSQNLYFGQTAGLAIGNPGDRPVAFSEKPFNREQVTEER